MAAPTRTARPALAKFAARQAPVDLDAGRSNRSLPTPRPSAVALARAGTERALDLTAFVQYPEQFLPVPFFSELPPELFPTARAVVAPGARRRRRRS